MGSLFSSCFKHSASDPYLSESENGENSSATLVVQGNSGGEGKSPTQQVVDMGTTTKQEDIANSSTKEGIQYSTAYDNGLFNSADSHTPLIPTNPIPYVPEVKTPSAPVSVKPIPRYDYVCEFLFDVKAVGNSVNLECRISWTKIDALLYLSVRIHMERRFLPSRRYFRRILEIKI